MINLPARSHGLRAVIPTMVVAVVDVGIWWLWLGRDHTYQHDPVTGVASGPYQVGQVLGCALTVGVVVVCATWVLPVLAAIVSTTVPFVVAWTWNASSDRTGLYAVGAFMLLLGMTCAVTGVAALVQAFRQTLIRRGRMPSDPAAQPVHLADPPMP